MHALLRRHTPKLFADGVAPSRRVTTHGVTVVFSNVAQMRKAFEAIHDATWDNDGIKLLRVKNGFHNTSKASYEGVLLERRTAILSCNLLHGPWHISHSPYVSKNRHLTS